MPLTDLQVRNAKPLEKPYKKSDGGGLFLEVKPTGAKYWRMAYRHQGKQKLLAIGVYPEVSLSNARDARKAGRALLATGLDPSQSRKEDKRLARYAAGNSLEAIAREWHDSRQASWTPEHAAKILHSLESNIFPALGNRPIGEITPPELLDELRKIEKRGALDIASRVLQRSSAVFRYAISSGRCTYNPAADLKGALQTAVVRHHAALGAGELPEYLRKLQSYDGHAQTRLGLQLLAYTFVRTGELRAAEWGEFDIDVAQWRIPAERMKMRDPHIVPLSRQSLEVLCQLRALNGDRRFVFSNQHRPDRCMSENTLLYALYRMGYHSRATGHGFRATASTILNERGYPPDVIERQLAHVERNKVRAAYNRAEYLPQRTMMMQHWADYLDTMASGAKIIHGNFANVA